MNAAINTSHKDEILYTLYARAARASFLGGSVRIPFCRLAPFCSIGGPRGDFVDFFTSRSETAVPNNVRVQFLLQFRDCESI